MTTEPNRDPHETWRVPEDQRLLFRQWDGDYAVYSCLSGETLKLDVVSGKVLQTIERAPASVESLRPSVAELLDVSNDPQLAEAVREILESLERAGLIEPASRNLP
jgi:PqqD family protein of HPr-rel-A system